MKADFVNYRRATNRSLLGMSIHLVLGLVLLIYAYRAQDHAAGTAAWFVLLGVAVWLVLAIVFDQHRRERIEAMEAETFAASDAAASSVFDESAADLRLAAKRLKAMHKWFVPGASLAIGTLLVLLGWWRYQTVPFEQAGSTLPPGWPISIGIGLAVLGFIFARYVSGMAKQPVWANLRGGAAYAAGMSLFGLALAVGHFVDHVGPDVVLNWLRVAFPIALVVLGAEVFLNFLLDVYRPRKAGDIPRPAFDSRILGFVAAPDRVAQSISEAIDYQLGYNVTGSWFYRLLSRFIGPLALLGIALLWGMTSLAVVEPHQRGMVLRFGRIVEGREDIGPGIHLKYPWPIDRVEVPAYGEIDPKTNRFVARTRTATGVRTIDAGSNPPTGKPGEPILWTTEHTAQELLMIVQPAASDRRGASGDEAESDVALVAVEIPIHYAVRDVEAYERLAPPGMRDQLLRSVAQRVAMRYIGSLTVDDVLDKARPQMAATLRQRIEAAFAGINPKQDGRPVVEVLFVGVSGAHPPQSVAPKFEQVIEAEQKRLARIDDARARQIRTLTEVVGNRELADEIAREIDARDAIRRQRGDADDPAAVESYERRLAEQELKIERLLGRAGGRAAAMLARAHADRWASHLGARGAAERYLGQIAMDTAAPAVYRAGLYFEALRDTMQDARVYITSDEIPLHIRTNLEDRNTGMDVLSNLGQEER